MPSNVPALDTAIGLAFVFFVLALVASAINELVAQAMKVRSRTLEQWIQQNLSPPTNRTIKAAASPVAKNTSDAVLNHPSVYGLTRNGRAPSYIPNGQFVTAVVSVGATRRRKELPQKETAARTNAVAKAVAAKDPETRREGTQEKIKAAKAAIDDKVEAQTAEVAATMKVHVDDVSDTHKAEIRREIEAAKVGTSTSAIHEQIGEIHEKTGKQGRLQARRIKRSVVNEATKTSQQIERDAATELQAAGQILQTDGTLAYDVVEYSRDEIKAAIDALPNCPIKDALLHAWARAGSDMVAFRMSAEKWFDDTMQRLSGNTNAGHRRSCT